MGTVSYSDRKMFAITFFKQLRKNALHTVFLFLFMTVCLNTVNAAMQIEALYDKNPLLLQEMQYCIGSQYPDEFTTACVCLVIGVSSVLLAFYNFRFMHSKKSGNVYYSLGIKRRTLFAGKLCAGVAAQCIGIILPFVICGLYNSYLYGSSEALWQAIAYYGCSMLAVSLFPFAVCVFTLTLTGSVIEGLVCGTVLSFATSAVYYGTYLFGTLMLAGANFDVRIYFKDGTGMLESAFGSVYGFFDFLYPVTNADYGDALVCFRNDLQMRELPSIGYPVLFLALFVFFAVAARFAFVRRKNENAGFLAACPRLFAATLFFAGALFVPVLAYISYDYYMYTTPATVIVALLYTACVFGIFVGVCAILLRSKTKLKAQLRTGGLMAGALAVFVLVFAFGGFGYEKRIPDSEKIAKAGITMNLADGAVGHNYSYTYTGMNDDLWSHPEATHGKSLLQTFLYSDGIWGSDSDFVVFDDEQSIETIREIHKLLLQDERNTYVTNGESIFIYYELANGQKLSRTYAQVSVPVQLLLQELLNTDDYREATAMHLEQYENADIVLYSKNATSMTNIFAVCEKWDKVQSDLHKAVIADVRAGNVPMDLQSDETPLGYLIFNYAGGAQQESYKSLRVDYLLYAGEMSVPVFETMTQTLAVLQRENLMQYFEDIATPVLATVYANPFNNADWEGWNSSWFDTLQFAGFVEWWTDGISSEEYLSRSTRLPLNSVSTDNAELIAQLTQNTTFTCFVNSPGYFVELRYIDEYGTYIDAVSFVPADKVPDILK